MLSAAPLSAPNPRRCIRDRHPWSVLLVRVADDRHGRRQDLLRRRRGLGHARRLGAPARDTRTAPSITVGGATRYDVVVLVRRGSAITCSRPANGLTLLTSVAATVARARIAVQNNLSRRQMEIFGKVAH